MSEYQRLADLTPVERFCRAKGPASDGGWHYHCFREPGHDGAHEAMAAEGESQPTTPAGSVRWP